jgi:flagella basal body P-ring formation protein FlgA
LTCSQPVAWRYVLRTDAAALQNRPGVVHAQEPTAKRWPVVLSKTSLTVGMILTADVLEETFVASPPSGQALKSLRQAVGMRLTAAVNSGAVLTTRNVARAPLVLKGETVTVMAGGQGFEIATPARAEEDGYEGDLISVKNSRTGAAMKGRLQHDKTVVVLKL